MVRGQGQWLKARVQGLVVQLEYKDLWSEDKDNDLRLEYKDLWSEDSDLWSEDKDLKSEDKDFLRTTTLEMTSYV